MDIELNPKRLRLLRNALQSYTYRLIFGFTYHPDETGLSWKKDMRRMCDAPILNMASPTYYANLMIRYMVAAKLTSLLPSLRITNVDLPYWGITAAPVQVKDSD